MERISSVLRGAVLAFALSTLSGCLLAAAGAAGAGAAAGVYLSDRGATALVEGPIADAENRARAVMRELGITVTETRATSDGSRKEFRGTTAELDVAVALEARSAVSTQVTATAKRSTVEFDRAYAERLVQRIVEQPYRSSTTP
jgi:hypothetical protein